MLSERQLQALLKVFQARFQTVTDEYLQTIGGHIARVKNLSKDDIHLLVEMRTCKLNQSVVRQKIAAAARMSVADVEKIFRHVAETDMEFAAQYFGAGVSDTIKRGINSTLPTAIEAILKAQLRVTAGTMMNLSRTTVVSPTYQNAISEAVQLVQTGIEDYNTSIRRAARKASSEGLRVRYDSGRTRRLDSAVRQNVLDGVRSLNQDVMRQCGEAYGADGVEISAHMLCALDHVDYQGRMFTQKDFDHLQTVELARPIGTWNCKHIAMPVIIGISPPAYSEDELAAYKRFSGQEITIGDKTLPRYGWEQERRRIETSVRYRNDAIKVLSASGDTAGVQLEESKIDGLKLRYDTITRTCGLDDDSRRMENIV